ncbi:MAG TPA: hypothetical protein VEX38_10620 [Fimbriimonadaceae bacterium]|nr:hypothetical protein [Fimbriimonadaceae bacterium]
METVSYGGWQCARLVSGKAELLVTLDVGPRVIRLGIIGGSNELHESDKDRGKKGGEEYRSYGGHRLWIAPEHPVRTLQPENEPVEHETEADWHIFRSKPDRFGIQKEIRITAPGDEGFLLEHRIYNTGVYAVELAPWALTVMAAGGECVFPHASHQAHSENFLPVRPLVLWSYTDMADPRWTWGSQVVRLRQDRERGPQKVGAFVGQGYACYANHGNTFVKRFDADPGADYTDFGCNFETFTRQDMLEVESLGPMQVVDAGAYAVLNEGWRLFPGTTPPQSDEACAKWLEGLAHECPAVLL